MYIVTINNGEMIHHAKEEKIAKGIATDHGWLMGGNVQITEVSDEEAERQRKKLQAKKIYPLNKAELMDLMIRFANQSSVSNAEEWLDEYLKKIKNQ